MICREQCQRNPRCKPGAAREQPVRLTVSLENFAWDFFPHIEINPFLRWVNWHRRKPTDGWAASELSGDGQLAMEKGRVVEKPLPRAITET
jgi:hypothetical protein